MQPAGSLQVAPGQRAEQAGRPRGGGPGPEESCYQQGQQQPAHPAACCSGKSSSTATPPPCSSAHITSEAELVSTFPLKPASNGADQALFDRGAQEPHAAFLSTSTADCKGLMGLARARIVLPIAVCAHQDTP